MPEPTKRSTPISAGYRWPDAYTVEAYQRQRARYERMKRVCQVVGYLVVGVGCGLFLAAMLLLPEVRL